MQMIYLFQGSRPLLCSLHLKITIKHLFMTLCQNMIMMYTSGFNLWSAILSAIHTYSSVLLALLHGANSSNSGQTFAARFTPEHFGSNFWFPRHTERRRRRRRGRRWRGRRRRGKFQASRPRSIPNRPQQAEPIWPGSIQNQRSTRAPPHKL